MSQVAKKLKGLRAEVLPVGEKSMCKSPGATGRTCELASGLEWRRLKQRAREMGSGEGRGRPCGTSSVRANEFCFFTLGPPHVFVITFYWHAELSSCSLDPVPHEA